MQKLDRHISILVAVCVISIEDDNMLLIFIFTFVFDHHFRTKWKRQTAVGLELLTEATNFATVQRMIHNNNYWSTFHPNITSLVTNLEQSIPRPRCPVPTSTQYLSSLFMSGALPSFMSHAQAQDDR
jgi:hypothetical protein